MTTRPPCAPRPDPTRPDPTRGTGPPPPTRDPPPPPPPRPAVSRPRRLPPSPVPCPSRRAPATRFTSARPPHPHPPRPVASPGLGSAMRRAGRLPFAPAASAGRLPGSARSPGHSGLRGPRPAAPPRPARPARSPRPRLGHSPVPVPRWVASPGRLGRSPHLGSARLGHCPSRLGLSPQTRLRSAGSPHYLGLGSARRARASAASSRARLYHTPRQKSRVRCTRAHIRRRLCHAPPLRDTSVALMSAPCPHPCPPPSASVTYPLCPATYPCKVKGRIRETSTIGSDKASIRRAAAGHGALMASAGASWPRWPGA